MPKLMDDATRYIIANTDPNWFSYLKKAAPREVNFWRPGAPPTKIAPGTPWFFKLRNTTRIVGCAFFAAYSVMPLKMAWETFGQANGVPDFNSFVRVIASLRHAPTTAISEVGCAALVDPVYFSTAVECERMYGPIRGQDTRDTDGAELWNALVQAMNRSQADYGISPLVLPGGRGAATLIRPRLGQSSFRTAVLSAYGRRCTITGERTLPVLEAAHIRPFAEAEEHDVRNGLLMRSDLHSLFDAGLVTVQSDLRVHVSSQIRERYENGRDYYALEGRLIRLPSNKREHPLTEYLDYHSSTIFQP
jgi:putative restriction endonuclease